LIARRLLGRLGYEVHALKDPSAVLPALCGADFDLWLLDLKLEELADLHAVADLRARVAPEAILIALGAARTASELRAWKAAGIDGQLDRPLDLQGLQRELARCRGARTRRAAKAAQAHAVPSALDVDALLEEVDGDRTLLANLAALFEEQARARMRELADAVGQSDGERVDHAAHALKSMIGLWQRGASYELAADLERMGRERTLDSAAQMLAHLSEALGELQGHIHELLRAGDHT
jgi:CheY-like chemotaxis protein